MANSISPSDKPIEPFTDSPIIVALDYASASEALLLARQLNPSSCRLKVGKELFTAAGPAIIDQLHDLGFEIFLDLKFHDIPNTTAQAVITAAELGVWMVNVHAICGSQTLNTVMQRLQGRQQQHRPMVIAVTVLTSMSDSDLYDLGITRSVEEQVLHLAKLSQSAQLDGVVCSAQEAKAIKQHCGEAFLAVTPGIRLREDATNDQQRICTPLDAIDQGSDYLVIGRSITQATDPAKKLRQIISSLSRTTTSQS